jgi:protein-disulfide isomerase
MKVCPWQAALALVVGAAAGWLVSQGTRDNQAGTGGPEDGQVLALVGGTELTQAEVETARRADFLQMKRQMHELTDQALDRAIQIQLVRLEADARGMDPAELVQEEVDDRTEDPTDEEVRAFQQLRGLQGSFGVLAPQIRPYLKEQARNARYSEFLGELEGRYTIERLLEPLRSEVAADGFPALGPRNAPVTIVEFSDFQCPYCAQLLGTLRQVQEAYGERVRLVYRQFPLANLHPDAQKAAEASLCAEAQGKFWEMHDAMFAGQRALGVPGLKETARATGLDAEEFDECLDSGRYAEEVADDLEAGRAVGVTGTPAMFINGRFLSGVQTFDAVAEIVDDELRRAGLSVERKGLEPARVEVEADGFPARGPEDAPVTIVEFSDFQCPFCYRLLPSLRQVVEEYGDQVRLVFRQFPLSSLHPAAQKAAEAALCANDQGRFWEMHDAMFENQQALGVDQLKETARSLGLDGAEFDSCLDSGQFAAEVAADLQAGRAAGVTGTPALFINGRFLSGARPFEDIAELVDDELQRMEG